MNPVSKFTTPRLRRERTALSENSDEKKDSVHVFCRLRPLEDDQESTCIKLLSPTVLVLNTPAESKGIRKEVHCKFKHIFTAYASQKEVFEHVAYPLLEDLLKGKNGLLFTYGVTGSGKTYTLTGDSTNPGIVPKCIYTIFNTIGDFQAPKYVIKPDRLNGFEIQSSDDAMQDKLNELRSASKTPLKSNKKHNNSYVNDGIKILDINESNLYSVFVNYIEIYNNTVYDLLDESNGKSIQSKILREDSSKNMYVNGVVEVEVKSAEEAFELFNLGQRRKKIGNTILNSVSSRSHSVFNVRIVQFKQSSQNEMGQEIVPDSNQMKVAQLSLVDLAGSERTNRTQNTGQLLKEASQINNSLMSLRSCLEILRENQLTGANRLVPYRDSRLTLLFKNYFEGEGRVAMIVCVNPSIEDFEENLQVMKFAETSQDVKVTRAEPKYTPCKKTIQKKATTPSIKVKPTSSFTLGPQLPHIKLNFDNFEENKIAIEKLCSILKARKHKLEAFDTEADRRQSHFRKRLVEINQENLLSVAELKSMKTLLKREKQKSANLENKLSDMEANNTNLQSQNAELQERIKSLQNTIYDKDIKINRNLMEKERVKQKLALQSEKMTHELDAKLRRQREHLQAAMKAKENKIRKVREILETEYALPEVQEKATEPIQQYELQLSPKSSTVKRDVYTPAKRQRRSRSAGEVWLEHNAVKPVPLGTVLQPSINKRKSVTKLNKASDVTNPKQSKYCLIAQEQDTDGEVETKVYKGDILPTCGGGAQVVFNDVERLRQESPTSGSK